MARGDMRARRRAVGGLVVKKNGGALGAPEIGLVEAPEKYRFIDPDIPGPQGTNHALMRGRRAGRHQRRANRRLLRGQGLLNLVQCGQKRLERPPG